ncbi:MAG: hypothetical protein DRZ79_04885 [Candidatus Cloacimonadota bacterium]|nr:MAG: hypothetical protein DRZ79_04885 [Candidatus Cloacimonadota bacterium]
MKLSRLIVFIAFLMLICNLAYSDPFELSGKSKTDFRSANMYAGQKIFEKALPLYLSVLKENPDHIESLERVAGIYFDIKKDYFTANEYYQKAIDSIESALAQYEELKKSDPAAAKKFYKKRIKKLKLEDKLESIKKFKKSCWIHIFKEAKNKFDNKSYDEAIEELNKLLEIAPDSIKTIKLIAYSYREKGDDENTLKFLQMAYGVDSTDVNVIDMIAAIYFDKKEYEKAAEWYKKESALEPQNPDIYFNIGSCYFNLRDDENALQAYAKVVELDSTNIDAAINAYNFANRLKKDNEAINYLKIAVNNDPENKDNLSILCYKLFQLKKYDDVIVYAEKWFALDNSSKEAAQLIYQAARMLGKKELENKYADILKNMQ